MTRRIHVPALSPGEIVLEESQAGHLRDVLRTKIGSTVELFDDNGKVAQAVVIRADSSEVRLLVDNIERVEKGAELIVASAVPKRDRADWMVEKLSELGVSRFIPLQTSRSVVHPKGQSKRERWMRLATESAKQSRRAGVMRIDELTSIPALIGEISSPIATPFSPRALAGSDQAVVGSDMQHNRSREDAGTTWFLSTSSEAIPMRELVNVHFASLTLLIGPEGGWTDDEIALFTDHRLTPVKLTATILRIETAAIAVAAIAATLGLHD